MRERAAVVAGNTRGLLRAVVTDRAPAVERARERGLYNAALDVGVRLIGPDGTAWGGPQPDVSVPLPDDAPEPITVRDGDTGWRALSVRITGRRNGVDGTLWPFPPDTTSEEQLGVVRTRVLTVAGVTAPLAGLLARAVAARATGRCGTCSSAPAGSTRAPLRPGWSMPRPGSPRWTTWPAPSRRCCPDMTSRPLVPPKDSPRPAPSRPRPHTNCAPR
ncbi:hypothetical protein V1460_20995 [Streptomyces sp. SCSIO 30461]|uniref:hypothetical protein n=1 Tax=Streptomyces sp. SCSIO 30461 TaxID=3118085 RepID=UPI0030D1A010